MTFDQQKNGKERNSKVQTLLSRSNGESEETTKGANSDYNAEKHD